MLFLKSNEKYPIAEAYNLPKASMGGTGCVIAKVRIAGLLHHSMVFSIPWKQGKGWKK